MMNYKQLHIQKQSAKLQNLTFIKRLPEKTIQSKNVLFKLIEVIFGTEELHSHKTCISFWGDSFKDTVFIPGVQYRVQANIESREYNDKWYTNIKA